jgi:flagellar protein FliT
MNTTQQILSVYEDMAELTGRMVTAAGNGDWDQLAELEGRCAAHVQMLKANEPVPPLTGPCRLKKVRIIQQILDDDRKIRDLTMPWMAKLSSMISSTGAERRLAHSYGAV